MTDKEKKSKIADILLEFYEEYQCNMPNRPMIPSLYASKIIDSLQKEPKDRCKGCNNVKGCVTCVDGSEWAHYHREDPVSEDLEEASNKYANTSAINNPPFAPKEFIKVAFKAGAQWQKVKSIVDVCYRLEMRLPEYLDYNGVRVERKDFVEDIKKTLNKD